MILTGITDSPSTNKFCVLSDIQIEEELGKDVIIYPFHKVIFVKILIVI